MAYALGKFARALCDRCAFEYKLSELREEWNGAKVCSECYEPKHPQLTPQLKAMYEEEFRRAADQDEDRASFRVRPDIRMR